MNLFEGYTIPVDFGSFYKTKQLPKCSIQESIARHLHLLIITTHEEFDFDAEYGCDIWDHEFEHEQTSQVWAEKLAHTMEEVLMRYESRIANIQVKAAVSQAEFEQKDGFNVAKRMKKKLRFDLKATLTSTNEEFNFSDSVLLSPFSTD